MNEEATERIESFETFLAPEVLCLLVCYQDLLVCKLAIAVKAPKYFGFFY